LRPEQLIAYCHHILIFNRAIIGCDTAIVVSVCIIARHARGNNSASATVSCVIGIDTVAPIIINDVAGSTVVCAYAVVIYIIHVINVVTATGPVIAAGTIIVTGGTVVTPPVTTKTDAQYITLLKGKKPRSPLSTI